MQNNLDRLSRIEALLLQSVTASDERMSRFEESANERMSRLEAAAIEDSEKVENLRVSLESLRDIVAGQQQEIRELTEDSKNLKESIELLRDQYVRHDRRIEQLLGYSITGESERLDLEQRIRVLERWKDQQGGSDAE